MMTRQEALRQRAGAFANLGDAFMATGVKYRSQYAFGQASKAYSAAEDIREQLDGEERKRP